MSDPRFPGERDPGMPRGHEITIAEYLDMPHRTELVYMLARNWASVDELGQVLAAAADRMDMTLFSSLRTELIDLLKYILKECEQSFIDSLSVGFLPTIYVNGYMTTEELETMGFNTGLAISVTEFASLDENISLEG